MNCSPAGSSVQGISKARILERVVIFSRGYSQPRDWTHVSCVSCIADAFFTHWVRGDLYTLLLLSNSGQFFSVPQSCLTPCYPTDCNTPGLPDITNSQSLLNLMSIELVMSSNHLILCHSLLLPPSIFPSIKVFSNESALCIRQPKYWSFSFNISPSNEHPRLISFRMDWLDLLAVQGTLRSLLQHRSSKPSILRGSAFFTVQLSHPYMTTEKPQAWLDGPLLTKWCLCSSICCLGWS